MLKKIPRPCIYFAFKLCIITESSRQQDKASEFYETPVNLILHLKQLYCIYKNLLIYEQS